MRDVVTSEAWAAIRRCRAPRAKEAMAALFALVSIACRDESSGGERWIACANALQGDHAPASVVTAVRAVGRDYALSCGTNHRACNPNAMPLETTLQLQHRQRVRAARDALKGRSLPDACEALPE
jgi:hypothetical protein